MSAAVLPDAIPAPAAPRRARLSAFLFRKGEPMIWLAGAGLSISLLLIFGLLALVAVRGLGFFWPHALVQIETKDGR